MSTQWVQLNVGGKVFQTTKQTMCLRPDSFLARLFADDNHLASNMDSNGAVLIDRNPDYFALILDFLRNGGQVNAIGGGNNINWKGLCHEAEFFGLPDLVKICSDEMAAKPSTVIIMGNHMTCGHGCGNYLIVGDPNSSTSGETCLLEAVNSYIARGYVIAHQQTPSYDSDRAWFKFRLKKN